MSQQEDSFLNTKSSRSISQWDEDIDEVICRNRVYQCLGCGFVGKEQAAEQHQITCDNPMELVR